MQERWRADGDKLTFIVSRKLDIPDAIVDGLMAGHDDETLEMLGDVNMFLTTVHDEEDAPVIFGELEIMIAAKHQHRKGYGKAALLAFLGYITRHETEIIHEFLKTRYWPTKKPSRFSYFTAKIGEHNHPSLALFSSLGFTKASEEPNYWGEYELKNASVTAAKAEEMMIANGVGEFIESLYQC